MASKINVIQILKKHNRTLRDEDNRYTKQDFFCFRIFPYLSGLFFIILVGVPGNQLVDIFGVCLSIFIGLFLNLLILIVSFVQKNYQVRDEDIRAELIKQTFYNISYTVIASLISLGLLFLTCLYIFPESLIFPAISQFAPFFADHIPLNELIHLVSAFFFYLWFTKVILVLLMVVKRIFRLFDIDIQEINKIKKKEKEREI